MEIDKEDFWKEAILSWWRLKTKDKCKQFIFLFKMSTEL